LPPRIGDLRIADGMAYVGTRLAAVGASGAAEPALIDPTLAVATRDPDRAGEHLPSSPSYAELPPASRLAYLTWLDDGRRDPRIHVGYVLLYLAGLERRLLVDRPEDEERAALLDEVRRLRTIYAGDPAFDGPSRRLLDAAGLLDAARDPAAAERRRCRTRRRTTLSRRRPRGCASRAGSGQGSRSGSRRR
jgi:hypothetical protein